MKRELKNYLINFGLSDIQAELYLFLLKKGPTKISEIAKNTGIKRISCYTALDKLKSLGLVKEDPKKYSRRVSAVSAGSIQHVLADRKRKLKKLEISLEQLLPEFDSLRKLKLEKNESELIFYQGKEEVKRAWLGPLLENETQLKVISTEKIIDNFPELYTEFVPARVDKRIHLQFIAPPEKTVVEHMRYDKEVLRETRIVRENFQIYSDIQFGEHKVLITNWIDPIFAVMIKNKFIIKNFHTIFDVLWKMLEPTKKQST